MSTPVRARSTRNLDDKWRTAPVIFFARGELRHQLSLSIGRVSRVPDSARGVIGIVLHVAAANYCLSAAMVVPRWRIWARTLRAGRPRKMRLKVCKSTGWRLLLWSVHGAAAPIDPPNCKMSRASSASSIHNPHHDITTHSLVRCCRRRASLPLGTRTNGTISSIYVLHARAAKMSSLADTVKAKVRVLAVSHPSGVFWPRKLSHSL